MLKDIDWIKTVILMGMAVCLLLLLREWDDFQVEREKLRIASEQSFSTNELLTLETAQIDDIAHTINNSSPNPSVIIDDDAFPLVGNDQIDDEPAEQNTSRYIEIETDVLSIQIDPVGGDFVGANLLQHQISKVDERPFPLLVSKSEETYVAKSGLLGTNGTDTSAGRPLFYSDQKSYSLGDDQDRLTVDLDYFQNEIGITKRFIFHRDSYLIDIQYLIDNQSTKNWSAAFYAQINRDDLQPPAGDGFGVNPYLGAAITTPDERYKKLDFEDIAEHRYRNTVDSGWVSLLQRYYLTAWIPQENLTVSYDIRKSQSKNLYYIGFTQPEVTIPAGSKGKLAAQFYVGPKDQYNLREIADYLDLTVDYGWLWWAAQPLYAVLYFIQSGEINSFNWNLEIFGGFGNWGVSIILLTVIVKLIFFPLSAASFKSMARMRKLTPKMNALKERYGNDKQAMSKEMMALYQKEKVNPMGGCLPILVQMPIFIALYWVLLESVEIRHAPFFGWLQDLSSKDPWFVLPLIMGACMWFQQRLNPPPMDPMQAKIMQFMPVMFTVMFLFFPSGLVLYWTVNQLLSIAQQWFVTKQIESGTIK